MLNLVSKKKKKKKNDCYCKRNKTSEHSILQSRLLPLPESRSRHHHFYNLTEYFEQNCSWEFVNSAIYIPLPAIG